MSVRRVAAIEWWKKAMDEVGVGCMDKLIPAQASWDEIVNTGRRDLEQARTITGLICGPDRTVVEVGCGVGRMTAALAEHFGSVVGLDVAPRFIEEARRRNTNPRVTFEVSDGIRLRPQSITKCDTVFSYEVFYYIDPESLLVYFRDAYELLEKQGQFVFHLNLEPVHLKTRASYLWRQSLYAFGIEKWRQWPTGPGLRRYCHTSDWLQKHLTEIGFCLQKIAGPSLRQKWVVATKA